MKLKQLSDIIPQMTGHKVGLKRILVSKDETESDITQIAVTTLRAGEETDRHCHPSMEEFFFFLSGKLELTARYDTRVCGQGDFVMVGCGEMHQLKAIEDTKLLTIGCEIKDGNE